MQSLRHLIHKLLGHDYDDNWRPPSIIGMRQATRQKNPYKRRGMGVTRASHEESKTRRKMAAASRRINRNHR